MGGRGRREEAKCERWVCVSMYILEEGKKASESQRGCLDLQRGREKIVGKGWLKEEEEERRRGKAEVGSKGYRRIPRHPEPREKRDSVQR